MTRTTNHAPAIPADAVPPTPQAQTPNVGGTPSYTPGPWFAGTMTMDAKEWAGLNNRKFPLDIVKRGVDVIAVVWSGDDRDGEEQANACLISLAPKMAEALRDAHEMMIETRRSVLADHPDNVLMSRIEALLSKLKGSN